MDPSDDLTHCEAIALVSRLTMFSLRALPHTTVLRASNQCARPLLVPRLNKPLRYFTSSRPVMSAAKDEVVLDKSTTEAKWKELLTPEEYYVLRQKGTEAPNTGKYNKFYEDGLYVCAGCGNPLYTSETKFNSGCGWPAYYDHLPGAVDRHEDSSYGMRRVEITCAKCGGHLGHVIEGEGFPTPTDQRHCVNSLSVKFVPGKKA